MVRRIRFEREVDFWERHHRSKVNRVRSWTQRLQYNPESIGYCVAVTTVWLADTERIPRRGCKVERWGHCPVTLQILYFHPVDISL
jgi:hypothetical protein